MRKDLSSITAAMRCTAACALLIILFEMQFLLLSCARVPTPILQSIISEGSCYRVTIPHAQESIEYNASRSSCRRCAHSCVHPSRAVLPSHCCVILGPGFSLPALTTAARLRCVYSSVPTYHFCFDWQAAECLTMKYKACKLPTR